MNSMPGPVRNVAGQEFPAVVKASEYSVCAYPDPESDWWRHFVIYVRHLGKGKWIVTSDRDGVECLDVDGKWTLRAGGDDWDSYIARTRFDERTALELARQVAPRMTIGGAKVMSIADAFARDLAARADGQP